MIDLSKKEIVLGDRVEPIKEWRVWFKTPFGYAETLDQALFTIRSADLNPYMTVQPIPVAFSETMHEVFDH